MLRGLVNEAIRERADTKYVKVQRKAEEAERSRSLDGDTVGEQLNAAELPSELEEGASTVLPVVVRRRVTQRNTTSPGTTPFPAGDQKEDT